MLAPPRAKAREAGGRSVRPRRSARPSGTRAEASLRRSEEQLRQALAEHAALLERERAARAEAESANRLKDQFLATLSHELRTPLSAILMWTRVLQEGLATTPALLQNALSAIQAGAEAQRALIEDLLDVSRIATGKLELEQHLLEVAPVVREAAEAILPAAKTKGVTVLVHLEEGAPLVRADAGRLRQVISNLLANALKFTPAGGRVEVRLSRTDGHAEIGVADTGHGIERDLLPHVFDRFRQGDTSRARASGGLGLGLAIAKQLVELHGGTIHAASPGPDQGATFTVRLPPARVRKRAPARKT